MCLAEGLDLLDVYANPQILIECVEDVALLALARGDVVRAARIMAAMERRREEIDYPVAPVRVNDRDQAVATIRESIGSDGLALAWEAGRDLDFGKAVDEAKSVCASG